MSKHFTPSPSWAGCCQLSGGDCPKCLSFPSQTLLFDLSVFIEVSFCLLARHHQEFLWCLFTAKVLQSCSYLSRGGLLRDFLMEKKISSVLGFWWLLCKITKLCIHHYLELDLGVRSTSMQSLPKRGWCLNPLVIFPITCFNNTQVWRGPSSFILDWYGSCQG